MPDFILLMHSDAPTPSRLAPADWSAYLTTLREAGAFQGGSSIGGGICVSQAPSPPQISRHLSGYIRIQADSLSEARDLVAGNPVYEAGGTVEVRELTKD